MEEPDSAQSPERGKSANQRKKRHEGLRGRLKMLGVSLNKRYSVGDMPLIGKEVVTEQGLTNYFQRRVLSSAQAQKAKRSKYGNPFDLYSSHALYLPQIPSRGLLLKNGKFVKDGAKRVESARFQDHSVHKKFNVSTELLPHLENSMEGAWDAFEGQDYLAKRKYATHRQFRDIKKSIAFAKVLAAQKASVIQSMNAQFQKEVLEMKRQEQILLKDRQWFEDYLDKLSSSAQETMDIAVSETQKTVDKDRQVKMLFKACHVLRQTLMELDGRMCKYRLYQAYMLQARKDVPDKEESELVEQRVDLGALHMQPCIGTETLLEGTLPMYIGESFIKRYLHVNDFESADLLFDTPKDFLEVLTVIERQNLAVFQSTQDMKENLEEIRKETDESIQMMNQEIKGVNEKIRELKEVLTWKENRLDEVETLLKQHTKIEIHFLEANTDLELLTEKIVSVFEAVVGKVAEDLSEVQMLKQIEDKFVLLTVEMDERSSHVIKTQIAEMKKRDIRNEQREKETEGDTNKAGNLAKSIARSLVPRYEKHGRQLYPRSPIIKHPPRCKVSKEKSDVKEDDEYEYFFT